MARFRLTYMSGFGHTRLVVVEAAGAFEAVRLGRLALDEQLGGPAPAYQYELVTIGRVRS